MKKQSTFLQKPFFVLLLLTTCAVAEVYGQGSGANVSNTIYSNVAQGKSITAYSSLDAAHPVTNATDGNLATSFITDYNENQWITIDLGKSYLLSSVIINWGKSYGIGYDVLISNNGSFTDLVADSLQVRNHIFKTSGTINTDTLSLKASRVARYVRVLGLHSASGNGYTIWELQVMGTTSSATLFPVSVSAFAASAAGTNNFLEWTTITEFSNAGFSVERSSDALNFSAIGWVAGRNAGSVVTHYSFTDKQATPGKNYYRLQQIWTDGKTGYSPVITVTIAGNNNNVAIYPVPVKDHLSVDYSGTPGESISIGIFNSAGIPVYANKYTLQGSQQTFSINRTTAMKAGQYFLTVTAPNKTYSEKILLQ